MRKLSIVMIVLVLFIITACNTRDKTLDKDTAKLKQEYEATKQEIIKLQDENLKNYKKATGVNLIHRDIEFDIENSIGKKFIIQGKASLSKYYNYGYKNLEKDAFSIKITPYDNSEAWYVYVARDNENGQKLFNKLKDIPDLDLIGVATISKAYYQKGQGNMAVLLEYV
ncbi:hypothetical protein [Paenibacillus sp. MBLB4367]|uniref:hypothetical protein n=1 Tax=Paenibacillus sp. MBLB4367 TaxID=3384767 RepID=UPI003907FB0A